MNKTVLSLLLVVLSCWSFAGEIVISTLPDECEILVRRPSDVNVIAVGRVMKDATFKMKLDDLVKRYGENGMFVLVARKSGYLDNQILLGHVGDEQVTLKLVLEPRQKFEDLGKLDNLISTLFEVQRLARIGDYSSALKNIGGIDSSFLRLSSIHEMEGSVHYFMKDYNKSLGSFRKAFNLNPDNMDAYYFKLHLENMLGIGKAVVSSKDSSRVVK